MAVAATMPSIDTTGLTLLMYSEEKFRQGDTKGALEDFQAASPFLQQKVVSEIYWNIWDLSKRPSGNPNFGEEAMLNQLVSHSAPDNFTKAEAIRLAVVKFHLDTVGKLLKRLEEAGTCPLSFEEMADPVIDFDGHTFERLEIERHYHRSSAGTNDVSVAECPISRKKGSAELITNFSVREVVQIYKDFGARLGHIGLFVQSLYDENKKFQEEIKSLKEEKDRMREERFKLWDVERTGLTQQIRQLRDLLVLATNEQRRTMGTLIEGQRQLAERQEQLDAANRKLLERQGQLNAVTGQLSEKQGQFDRAEQQLSERQEQLDAANRQLSERQRQLDTSHRQLRDSSLQIISMHQQLLTAQVQLRQDRASFLTIQQSYSNMSFCDRLAFLVKA